MNRVFKTRWSVARQQYVVTDEEHAAKGKASKSVVALAVAAAAALTAGAASAAYVEPGFVAQTAEDVAKATASWETAEYFDDWGLKAMNASSAYALGYNGDGIAVGVMDSGALLFDHPDLNGDRFHAVTVENQSYGSWGNRYPQHEGGDGIYTPDSEVPDSGSWQMGMNDSHGTHVTGTVGGNRDGNVFHGVAWGADIYVGNTGGTDDTNYGPFQDPQFFYQGWNAIAKELSKANKFSDGTTRGGFINNSFGTNTRVVDNGSTGTDGGSTGVHFPTDTVSQTEYEYFLFMRDAENRVNTDSKWDNKSFVDAAFDAVKDEKVVQIFTTGNRDFANPFYRPLYPYFNPEAEQHWIAVSGLTKDGDNNYKLWNTVNEAGNAKWWTVVAPGTNISSSIVNDDGTPGYSNTYSGTSMAAPHVDGAMAVLMQRYDQMDALQVRDVMLTTATHYNPDGSIMEGWTNTDGTTPKDGEVSDRMGWGLPDLKKGMYGPGQLLGTFTYNMRDKDSIDVWSNDISEVALNQRQAEDADWKAAAEKWYAAGKPIKLEDGTIPFNDEEKKLIGDILLDTEDDIVGLYPDDEMISKEEALRWRDAYFQKRLQAIDKREYDGSLVKEGEGTLVMTGTNSYEGTTTVKGGTLLAFGESIGKNKTVTVEGGTFGVISGYTDNFTLTGSHTSTTAADTGLTINVADGASLYVSAAGDVTVDQVTFGSNAKIIVGVEGAAPEQLAKAYTNGDAVDGTFTTKAGSLAGASTSIEQQDSAFFTVSNTVEFSADGKTLSTKLDRKEGVTYGTFARTANERAIAQALETQTNAFAGEILSMTADEVSNTYASLSDDMYSAARNALVVNSTMVTRAVIDQARGFGEGRAAELENGRGRIWATGIGFWGDADGSERSLDVDFRAGFLGGEVVAHESTKLGAFFGYGSTDYQGDLGKIDGDDLHYGIYGLTDIGAVSLTYGVNYTTEDRDSQHLMGETQNAHSEDATVLQAYAEAAYKFDVGGLSIDPYLGFAWARVETDGFAENLGSTAMSVKDQKDDIQMTTLGARFTLPFTMGTMPVAFKADAGWTHYFGDTESITQLQLGAGGNVAQIQGKELKDQFNLGLGVNGQVAKNVTVGVSYTGSFGTDTDTHGVIGNVRFAF
ncbi:autotransporter domain-containing protein [Sutterella megalosphaeroides]|uniref:Outer membrane autotransporter barrel domain-containing protein n=1 Tax=Sutterella megalosphaeroides TaxID=2494234 RepID=A0A2Z6IAN8_9BURK|nr:autotransporter domain-containing protein [Sutterella megalosphaeroides]BBF23585.1 outer membrane autotransporter barrel domain-containing protein [Sutterella megalosphaeroides]